MNRFRNARGSPAFEAFKRTDRRAEDGDAQRLPEQGGAAIDAGDVTKHAWPEADRIERQAVAGASCFRLTATDQVIPVVAIEGLMCCTDEFVKVLEPKFQVGIVHRWFDRLLSDGSGFGGRHGGVAGLSCRRCRCVRHLDAGRYRGPSLSRVNRSMRRNLSSGANNSPCFDDPKRSNLGIVVDRRGSKYEAVTFDGMAKDQRLVLQYSAPPDCFEIVFASKRRREDARVRSDPSAESAPQKAQQPHAVHLR